MHTRRQRESRLFKEVMLASEGPHVPRGLAFSCCARSDPQRLTQRLTSASPTSAAILASPQDLSTRRHRLGGQGSVLSLNAYEAAAKVVVHHVASDRSIDDLARRIADQILAQKPEASILAPARCG